MNANGIDLYYEVHGEGAPILGIHGTPSSALLWVDAARALASRGGCIIYDRRGFFRSERPEPSNTVDLSDHVDDAAALLDALSATPAVVIGRSTGGEIALALARRFPDKVKALVLLEPAVFTVDPEAAVWAERLRISVLQAAAGDPSSAAEARVPGGARGPGLGIASRGAEGVVHQGQPGGPGGDQWPGPRPQRGTPRPQQRGTLDLSGEELAGMGQPTLIVSSEDSPEVLRRVNDRLADALPHTEKVLVTGGHLINPAHPAVLEFVGRILTPGRNPA